MDEIKAIYTGMAVGGVLGSGAVIVGTFAVPVIGPIVGTFLFIGGILGGAVPVEMPLLKSQKRSTAKIKKRGNYEFKKPQIRDWRLQKSIGIYAADKVKLILNIKGRS